MKTYLLLFRADYKAIAEVSSAEMQRRNTDWMAWVDNIAVQGKLLGGNHLGDDGRIVKGGDVVQDGTIETDGNSILGYLLVEADAYEDGVMIAKGCPILSGEGNSVEVRALHAL